MSPIRTFVVISACSFLLPAQTVSTSQYNIQRTAANTTETTLTQSNVSGLIKLGSFAVDGPVFAQPLIIDGVSIGGATRLLIVATVSGPNVPANGGSLYAFNADAPGTSPIWHVNLVTPPVAGDGCLATPVVDTANAVVYAVCQGAGSQLWLFALKLADGSTWHAATQIGCTYSGVTMNTDVEGVRTGLLLYGGQIYFGASSVLTTNELTDGTRGWVFEYNAATLAQTNCMTVVPNVVSGVGGAGIWQAGVGFAVDSGGNIRFATGNGVWNGSTANYGESIMKLSPSLSVLDYFTPADWSNLNSGDTDQDAGGIMVVGPHLFQWGKSGILWVDPGGGLNGSGGSAVQSWDTGLENGQYSSSVIGSMAFGNNVLYLSGSGPNNAGPIHAYTWNGSTFNTTPAATSATTYAKPGARLSYSSNGSVASTELLWAITAASPQTSNSSSYMLAGTLHAFNASTLSELWNSDNSSVNAMGFASRFVQPTIADGKIYVPTSSEVVVVYGLGNLTTPTVTFTGAPATAPYNSTFTVSATTNASTTASIVASGACSIAGNTVTMTSAAGTCFLTATWAADSNYSSATATQSTIATNQVVPSSPWPNGYNYQATFTVTAGQVPSAQTSFPALISGTFADFATSANGGGIINTCTQTVGNNATTVPCDLIFTSDAAGAMPLSWEFETYAPTTGAVNIWVNAPNLSDGTVIYAWYGQALVNTLQTTPAATWSSNFMAVYHLKESPAGTAPQMNDSTANANNATMSGMLLASQQEPGEIGGSVNFEGDTWADPANPANFSFERTNSFSLSGWFRIASNSSGTLLSKFLSGGAGWALIQEPGSAGPVFEFGLFGSGESTMALAETPAVTTGAWHYVVATYSGIGTVAGMNIYVDGVSRPLTTINDNLATSILNDTTPAINGRGGPDQMSTDTMDEIRVSTQGVVFSPAYVTASFNNQSQPGTFFAAVTGLTNASGGSLSPSPSSVSFPNQNVGSTGTAQGITLTNNGPGAATIGGIAITGTNPGDFAQTNNCPLAPATLAANAFCTIDITFTPVVAGGRSAAVSIAGASPGSVGLSGTGILVPSTVTLSPTSLTFANQTVNTTSGVLGIKVANSGPSPLTIDSIAVTGTNRGDFSQTNNCPVSPATIAVNGFCTIKVTFKPLAAGTFSAAITITDNGAAGPQSVGLSGTGTAVVFQTWPNGYNYQATFTVAAGQVPSPQTNFPALISGTFADFATTANGGRISNTCAQTVGNNATTVPCDLIFTSDAAGTMLLNWEFETYAAATGAVNIWVNAPNLANGTVIYAWYGQASVTTLQTTPSATWSSNFMAVYHLKENPAGTAPQINDSTANANNATMNGTVQASQQQPGEIDGGINFEGDTWASLANPSNFSFDRTNSFSLSGWFKIASNAAGTLISKFLNQNAGWALIQEPGSANPYFEFGLFGTGMSTMALAETPAVSTGAWHYVVATYSGTGTVAGMNVYVDGVNEPLNTLNDNLATSIVNTATPAINGRGGPTQMSTDTMDEIRISAPGVVFSPAYVTASFKNQSQPATFFTVVTGLTNP